MLIGCFANRPNLMLSNKYKIGENDFRCKGCDDSKFHHILYRTMYNLVANGAEEIENVVVDTFLRSYPEQYEICKQYDFMSFIPEIKRVASDKNVAYHYDIVRKFAMLREYKATGFDIHEIYDETKDEASQRNKLNSISLRDIDEYFESKRLAIKRNFISTDNVEHYKAGDDFDATGKKTILIIRKPEEALSASFENRHNVDDLLFAVENQYFYKYGGENIIFALATEDISLISANIEKQVEMYVPVPVVDNKNLIDIISELLAKQNSEYADIALDDKEIGEIALILMPNSDGAYNLNQIKQIVTRSYKNSVETSTKISDNVSKIANATQRYISKAQIDAYEKKVSATF